jgi:hypothetical protein
MRGVDMGGPINHERQRRIGVNVPGKELYGQDYTHVAAGSTFLRMESER